MKKPLVIFLPLLMLFAAPNVYSEKTLRLSGPPWPPFLNEDNPEQGLSTEIVGSALNKAGYQTQISIKPWRRVLAEAKSGHIDILIGLWFNEERTNSFAYSAPYYYNKIHLVSRKTSNHQFELLQDLKFLRIGVRQGASFGKEFDEASYLQKIFVPSANNMLHMLVRERLDLGVGDQLILKGLIEKDESLADKITFLEPAVTVLPLHMAVVKALPDYQTIINDFNQSLEKMKQSGELSKIYSKYGVSHSQQ